MQKAFYLFGVISLIVVAISIIAIAMFMYNDDSRKAELAQIQKETYITSLYGQYTQDLGSCRDVANKNNVENGDVKCKDAVNGSRIGQLLQVWGYDSLLEK